MSNAIRQLNTPQRLTLVALVLLALGLLLLWQPLSTAVGYSDATLALTALSFLATTSLVACALCDNDARTRAIVEAATDGIVVNERGIVESINPAALSIFKDTLAEVVGNNISMLVPSPHAEQHDGYLARCSQTGQSQGVGFRRRVVGVVGCLQYDSCLRNSGRCEVTFSRRRRPPYCADNRAG
jgi:PAS domain S-box-containing protein